MNISKSIVTLNPCYKAGRTIIVKGLMLHSVGCSQPSAKVFVGIYDKSSYSSACVHGFIDANDGSIIQTLPWNHRAWHCKGAANNTHIGIEMCEPACIKYTSGGRFTCSDKATAQAAVRRTYNAAVELFAYLCKLYGLNPLGDGVIISHKEGCSRGVASNHGDPEHLWNGLGMGYTMNGFRQDVKKAMNGSFNESEENEVSRAEYEALEKRISAVEKKLQAQGMDSDMVYNYIDKNMPEWAHEAAQWCVDKGIIKGTDDKGSLGLTDMKLWVCVVLYRAVKFIGKIIKVRI